MRTLTILIAGFVLLTILLLLGRRAGNPSQASLVFIGLWLIVTVANGAFGVLKAGYSAKEEFPVLLALFLPPAGTAILVRRRSLGAG